MMMTDLIQKLSEWRDAREAVFAADFGKMPSTESKPLWGRLAKAEHDLMDQARKLPVDASPMAAEPFDFWEYLMMKAQAEGLQPSLGIPDSMVYLFGDGYKWFSVSTSGLDFAADEKDVKNVLDIRFANALKTFRNGERILSG